MYLYAFFSLNRVSARDTLGSILSHSKKELRSREFTSRVRQLLENNFPETRLAFPRDFLSCFATRSRRASRRHSEKGSPASIEPIYLRPSVRVIAHRTPVSPFSKREAALPLAPPTPTLSRASDEIFVRHRGAPAGPNEVNPR